MGVGGVIRQRSFCEPVAYPRVLARLCIWLLVFGAQSAAASLPDVIDRIRPAVVGVGTVRPVRQPGASGPPVKFMGTGFVVDDGSLVATNYHVIPETLDTDSRETLSVFSGRGSDAIMRNAEVVATDPEHDIAILRLEGAPLPSVKLGRADSVREGQDIAFTGFPIGVVLGLYPVTHRGIVSVITPTVIPADRAGNLTSAQMRRLRNPFNVFQLDATAYPGNSGSPVYDASSGDVIGVLNSVFVKETKETVLQKPSGISYAIPVTYVRQLLKQIKQARTQGDDNG